MHTIAVEFSAPYTVDLVEVQIPKPEPGEALVRVQFSGISAGTEMLAYRGQIDESTPLDEKLGALAGTFSFPFKFGYSCVGTVERSGGRLPVGAQVFAFHPHQAQIVVPESELVEMSAADPRRATLFPLVETALQISLDAGAISFAVVVVFGLGAVGILTGALLAKMGARVIGIDPEPARREVASEFGVETHAPKEAADAVRHYGRAGVPLVVEVSGNPAALRDALGLLGHEGTVLVASWYGSRPVALPLGDAFHRRRLTIRSTQVSTIPAAQSSMWTVERRRRTAAKLLNELRLGRLATHEFPIAHAAQAFASVDKGEPGLIHAALSYGEDS